MTGLVWTTLPAGLWRNDTHYREAGLRPLTGEDALFLLEAAGRLLPAERTTVLLARCVSQVAGQSPVTLELVRMLAVGDREALLLHLRRLTLGERIQSVARCPRVECGERMDVEFNIGDVLQPPYAA